MRNCVCVSFVSIVWSKSVPGVASLFDFCFFFFQAEDGIRDWSVTGVQTCALPIYMSLGGGVQGPHDFLADFSDAAVDAGVVVVAAAGNSGPGDSTAESPGSGRKVRSEERRVGKECRSRWSP